MNHLYIARRRVRVVRATALSVAVALSPMIADPALVHADASVTAVSGLAQGARGDAVRAVQQALVNQGIAVPGGVDGIFGAGTATALQQFQASKGLPATGVVDDATALVLGLASSPLLGLAQGTSGDAVKSLQEKLIAAGIVVAGGADGVFGAGTAAAVKAFQTVKGLAATGAVDAATAAALGGVTAAPTPAPAPAPTPAPTASGIVGLKIDAKGDNVKTLQQQLIAVGFTIVGAADGIFGVRTANALSSFQNSVGLAANAVVDDATAAALADAVARAGGGNTGGGSTGAPPATSPLLGLKYGSAGDAVKTLQQTLITAGITVRGGADGVFGLSTQGALKQYQQLAGIATSGLVDEATASALASGKSVTGTSSTLVGLKAGSLGGSVKQLQESLITLGITVRGGADGVFGPATSSALKAFQTSQGLDATGVVDDATVAALQNPTPITGGGGGGGSTSSSGFATYGEKGTRVLALQAALVNNGITVRGGVDGDFGPGTSAAIMDFQRAKGLRVTGAVNEETAAALGLSAMAPPTAAEPGSVTLQVFPVQGRCYFSDTWMYARSGGRLHLGVDIMATEGKLIYAALDGTITKVYADYPGSLSGNGVRISQDDGTYVFYAHMVSVAEGLTVGSKVRAGQVVGYVGRTGNAAANHLHLEVHPKGGSAINPFPLVKAIDACNVTEPLPQG